VANEPMIEIEGLEEAIKKLEKIGKLEPVKAAIKAGGKYLKGRIARYPPRKHVSIQEVGGWASEKQRRWFFANLREGKIDVPYRRGISPGTERLGQKWTEQIRDGGFTVVVGNNVSYARFVQKPGEQTSMMKKIGWKTTVQVADEEARKVQNDVKNAIMKAIGAM